MCVCKIAADRDELVWSSAGHPAPILDSGGTIGALQGTIAPPLGIAPRSRLAEEHRAPRLVATGSCSIPTASRRVVPVPALGSA